MHYDISFKVMSQRLNNDNILEEQGCAGIKKQTFCEFPEQKYGNFDQTLGFRVIWDWGSRAQWREIQNNLQSP